MKVVINGSEADYPYIFVDGVKMPATFIARPANPRVDMGRRIIIEPALPEGGNTLLTADYLDFEINEVVISDNPSAYTPADVLRFLNEGHESPTDDDFPGIGSGLYSGGGGSPEIPDGSITTAKLADNAVTSAKIKPSAVGTSQLAVGAVSGDIIQKNTIVASKLADGCVGAAAIADRAVTGDKIANAAVTSAKLAPGLDVSGLFFILPEDTQFPYTLTEGDKAKLANARFLVCVGGDGSISVALHPVEKSYVGSWMGVYSTSRFAYIGVTESIIDAPSSLPLNDSCAVSFRVLQTLTTAQRLQARTNIGAAEVGAVELAPLSVTTDKIADGAVTTNKLAASSVATEKLQDLCVTTPKIANQAVDTTKLNTGGSPGGSVE